MERISSQNSFKFSPVSVSFRIGGKVEYWSELADESHEEASQPVAQATTPAEFYHYFKEYKDSKSVEDPSNTREWKLFGQLWICRDCGMSRPTTQRAILTFHTSSSLGPDYADAIKFLQTNSCISRYH